MDSEIEKTEMRSMASCMNKLHIQGFTENFMINEYGLRALNSEKYYTPEEVKITDFYRFEGESDPADNSILYALETRDGVKGMVSDAYGAYGDNKIMKFMARVEEIMKNTNPKFAGENNTNSPQVPDVNS
ncbi:MAG: hypothetical protein H0W62_00960 [Chitinophagales bacterium]|nr:hypothetical protein [Chitinophagales bacterium]